MAEQIQVNPTPIQRNAFDVAIELTQLYTQRYSFDQNELEQMFTKYYAIARVLERTHPNDLQNLVPKDIITQIKR
ncbi:hypothetical protein [Ammoniphilus sp. YIM 78166]|uniref:hypothetical protein n=1 Tax=Ammoniphilus sp. YIM 78166 TaxID=1644106 RepID=UPI00106FB5CA|nr:hypothetical protein [Ammoniphilus sp. YIM 78166]